MNIRETLQAVVEFLRRGHQSGNTTAAIKGIENGAEHQGWPAPALVLPTEQDAARARKHLGVQCMSLSDTGRVRAALPGPVVFDTWTVEFLAIAALQRIQSLEAERDDLAIHRDRAAAAIERKDRVIADLHAEIARLRAEAGRVVVPERAAWLTIDEISDVVLAKCGIPRGYANEIAKAIADTSMAKGAHSVPSSRVLKDGEVAVGKEECDCLQRIVCAGRNWQADTKENALEDLSWELGVLKWIRDPDSAREES